MGPDTEQSRPCMARKYLAAYCSLQNTPSLMQPIQPIQPIQPVDSCIKARSTGLRAYDSCTLSKQLLTRLKTGLEDAAASPNTMGVKVSMSLLLPLQACLPSPKPRFRADSQGRHSLPSHEHAGMGELNPESITLILALGSQEREHEQSFRPMTWPPYWHIHQNRTTRQAQFLIPRDGTNLSPRS